MGDITGWLESHKYKPLPPADAYDLDSDELFILPNSLFVDSAHGEGFAFSSLKVRLSFSFLFLFRFAYFVVFAAHAER